MSAAVSVWWLAARWPSAIATFHLLADNSRAMYSISLTLVSLIRACFVVPISILLGGLVGMYFLPQEARLGEPFIASPPLRTSEDVSLTLPSPMGRGTVSLLGRETSTSPFVIGTSLTCDHDRPKEATDIPSLAKRGRCYEGLAKSSFLR